MLIIALVLALIGLVALVFAVVTSNVLVAWVCIGASVLGVILLIVDAVRERQQRDASGDEKDATDEDEDDGEPLDAVDYPDEADAAEEPAAEPASEPADAPAVDENSKK
ncbi:hypothetical protein [Mycobacterium paragordonae]|jgi:hypothetical protein|uniref:hypothetical protein n=1 Tax=Mycobacterium paragordonae TaxID=1389713 RepID=UPI0007ECDE80|nr:MULTISPECIES: hypothetical protein [Mycobacterium]OBJ78013.1 hypothetical protein A9W97_04880 [Mycobacterium gordonae]